MLVESNVFGWFKPFLARWPTIFACFNEMLFFLLKWPNHVYSLAIPEFHVGVPCLCDSSTAPQNSLHRSNAHELRSEWPMGGAGRKEGHLSDGRRGAARPHGNGARTVAPRDNGGRLLDLLNGE